MPVKQPPRVTRERKAASATAALELPATNENTRKAAMSPSGSSEQAVFEVRPREIVFADFVMHESYEVALSLKNISREAQFVRVRQSHDRFVTLVSPLPHAKSTKVAPGLTVVYKVVFRSEDERDYSSDIIVTTSQEEFTIPLRAIANRGRLDLPESFAVSPSPVKCSGSTTLFLRNKGKLDCQWRAVCQAPFAISPSSGVVPSEGGVLPVSIVFTPPKLQTYSGSIVFLLGPEENAVQELPVSGSAMELSIIQDKSEALFPDTFVTLESQVMISVRNESDRTIHFTWKAEQTDHQEKCATENAIAEQSGALTYAVLSNAEHESTRQRLAREYIDHLTKGGRVFDDDVFTIEPVSGVIYGKGSREFIVTFNPQLAVSYLSTAYLDIEGKNQRLPLQMKGKGLAPLCELEFTTLDIGDIVVGAVHEYRVEIINKGCVEARYKVMPQDTLMGRKFSFSPPEGVLPPGTTETFVIRLESDLLGIILETFNIHIHGALDGLKLFFRGRVTSPSLQFNRKELNFGNVSYTTHHSCSLQVMNTGSFDIRYKLRIPESSPLCNCITVTPCEGLIPEGGVHDICVDLVSNALGSRETKLLVDVEDVGDAVHTLPIKFFCLVPTLQPSQDQLHYGHCFVGHNYTMNLEVVNKTALVGKFSVFLQELLDTQADTAIVSIGSPDNTDGVEVIEARSRCLVPITLTPLAVGELRMTLYVRVLGSEEQLMPVLVTASACGPTVVAVPRHLSFGGLQLLDEKELQLTLTNMSSITAYFTTEFLLGAAKTEEPVFFLEPTEGEIEPEGTFIIKVRARLDEARTFEEKIRVAVRHSEKTSQVIDVVANGKGYALVPQDDADEFDFGDIFTETTVEKKLIILNKGRRDIEVIWSGLSRNRAGRGGMPNVFSVNPEMALIPARKSYEFVVQGYATTKGVFSDCFTLKDKNRYKVVLSKSVQGNFITPSIAYSTKKVVFDYIYGTEGDTGCAVTTKTFTMKNTCTRTLHVSLRCLTPANGSSSPFTLENPTTFALSSGETRIVGVTCDALYRRDNIAHSAKGRVLVTFSNHTTTEYVYLTVNIALPNVSIVPDTRQLNFGSVLADTEKRLQITLTNLSEIVSANFHWGIETLGHPAATSNAKVPLAEEEEREEQQEQQLIRKHFDIIPFRGSIPPGGKTVVEAVFYGARGRHEANAKCSLEGGPSYSVNLIGWSDVAVRFDRTSLDFGIMHYKDRATRTICISSPLRVAVPFSVDLTRLKQPESLTVRPLRGTVTTKVYLTVTFGPMIPEEVIETFTVQVGHLHPQVIKVRGLGQVSTMSVVPGEKNVKLRRVEDPIFQEFFNELSKREWVPHHTKMGSSNPIPHVDPSVLEAERLTLCQTILPTRELVPSVCSASPPPQTTTSEGQQEEIPPLLARYILDFGHVTRQDVRTAKLLLVNTSTCSTSISLEKNSQQPPVVTVEPLKIPTMAPISHTEFVVTLHASEIEKGSTGADRREITLNLAKGPRVIIEVHYYLATPMLTPESHVVDFGDLRPGHIHVKNVHFYNNEAAPCSWTFKLIETKKKGEAQDPRRSPSIETVYKKQFKIGKERGILPPYSCMAVQMSFHSWYVGPAKARLRLRFASNPNDEYMTIIGNVRDVKVNISPTPVNFLPLLPCEAVYHTLTITNNEEHPIEVVCMNYDQKVRIERRALQRFLQGVTPTQEEKGLYLPLREAGDALPEGLLDATFENLNAEETALEFVGVDESLERALERRRGSYSSRAGQIGRQPSRRQSMDKPDAIALRSKSLSCKNSFSVVNPKVIVVVGPPCSGKTTQTQKLKESSGVVELDLDAMILSEAEFDTAEGELIRGLLSDYDKLHAAPPVMPTGRHSDKLNPLLPLANSKVVILLHTLVVRQLKKVDNVTAVVIDDLKSIITENREAVLFAISKAAQVTGMTLKIISLGVSEVTADLRRNLDIQRKCNETAEAAKIPLLTEEEYEELSEGERDTYNHQLLYYNKCKRDLAEVTKEVTRLAEEKENNEQHTVQKVIDAEMAAKEEMEERMRASTKGKRYVPEQRPAPVWHKLSDLERYKELYIHLRERKDLDHIIVDGENCKDLTEHVISNENSNGALDAFLRGSVTENANDKNRLINIWNFGANGVWEFVSEEYLNTTHEAYEGLRIFSRTPRDLSTKKNPKGAVPVVASPLVEASRWLIAPMSSTDVTLVFCSSRLGQFSTPLTFGITGTSQQIVVPVATSTLYPDICRDEKRIFRTVKTRAVAGRQVSGVFLLSKRSYEFGPLIVHGNDGSACGNSKVSSSLRNESPSMGKSTSSFRGWVAQDTLTLTNDGIVPAEVNMSFGKEKDLTFAVAPNKVTIPVGETVTVMLRANPESIGEITAKLVVTVRDNPAPWFVNVSCIGTRPSVTLDGKRDLVVQYGRSLVTRPVEKTFTISNVSFVPVHWRITGMDKLPSEFELSATSGVLEVSGAQKLALAFKPIKPGMHSLSLKVEVMDSEEALYESLPLTIKAEAHDAVVEWTRHVNFKMIHVGETKKELIRILNKSPYDIGYMLRMPKALQNVITLSPVSGTVRGLIGYRDAAIASVEVSIRFDREGEIPPTLGVIEASFYDPQSNELLYPVQNITVTGEAWYNQFSVRPSFIDFGPCVAHQKKVSTFELRNTGRFPLNFKLFNYKKATSVSTPEEEEFVPRRGRKTAKGDVGFQLGSFNISPNVGVVGVGDSCTFNVTSVLSNLQDQREVLGIHVDHCDPEIEKTGTAFHIVASPTTPGIVGNLSSSLDVETVFEEQQIVTSLSCFNGPVRAFAKEECLFSFGQSLLGSRVEERFRIANLCTLTCTVKVRLLPKNMYEWKEKDRKDRKDKSAHGTAEGFLLLIDGELREEGTIELSSFESRFVTVCFAPQTLQSFTARFEAIAVDGTNPATNSLRFDLAGEGILPTVQYIFPPPLQITAPIIVNTVSGTGGKGKGKESRKAAVAKPTAHEVAPPPPADTIQMPLTFVGSSVTRCFRVRNNSDIPVHIRLTAPDDVPLGMTVTKLKEQLLVPPTGEEAFSVTLAPHKVDKWKTRLRVSVTENPFDDRELWVVGESFHRPISFHNTDPLMEERLTLGYWYLSQVKEHTFTVANNTPFAVRFEWNQSSRALSFSPRVGHLPSGASRDITVRLYSEAVSKDNVLCVMQVTSIECVDGDDWDDRQTKERWLSTVVSETDDVSAISDGEGRPTFRKVVGAVAEPAYRATENFSCNKNLVVSYACEPTTYELTLPSNENVELSEGITFPTTKIFQKRFITMRIENTGPNVLPFSIEVKKNEDEERTSLDLSGVFIAEPSSGAVEPHTTCDIRVTFAPKCVDVADRVLVVNLKHSAKPQHIIPLQGSAECPLVHFNIPQCDYFSTRVDGEAGSVILPNTIPVVFNVCGLNTKSVVTFKVINPTATIQRYEWISNEMSRHLAPFRCLTPAGSISAGKQCEMAFEYTSTSLATRESLWNFFISGQTSVPFMLVGKAHEPNLFLNVNKVFFGGTPVGSKNERVVILENKEDSPFSFSFDNASMNSEKDFVGMKPTRGVVQAKSSVQITIWFCPKEEIAVNMKLVCRVKRASNPLTINVKGEGLRTHSSMCIEDVEGAEHKEPIVVTPYHPFQYNLGRTQVNTIVKKKLVISNEGSCPFDFVMTTPEHRFLTFSGTFGTLQPKQRAEVTLVYFPTSSEALRNLTLACRISKRVVYTIRLSAASYTPKVILGFSRYDFGLCFVSEYMCGQTPPSVLLNLTNGETDESVTVDYILPEGQYFDMDTASTVLAPGETKRAKITFNPAEVGEFGCDLKLLVNGHYPLFVPIRGEGVVPRIEVSSRFLRLGVARIGERRTAELRLECRSRTLTTVSLANCIDVELAARGISLFPSEEFVMRPDEARTITAVFKPQSRMAEFQREISMVVCGKEMPFALITASCEDAEVHLDVQNVLFNNVVVGAVSTQRVVIMNSGDISQRFSWDAAMKTNRDLKIIPAAGVIRAHAEQACELTYNPTQVGSSIHQTFLLEFDNAPPIPLNLEAHCVDIPKPDTVLEFTCKIRSSVTKTLTIENPTNTVWTLRPTINNKFWSTVKSLTVNPKSRALLSVTYSPFLYTKEKDIGNLFIPLPSGEGRSVQLEGIPQSAFEGGSANEKVVEANTVHTEIFELQNDTPNTLRFRSSANWLTEPDKGTVTVKMPMTIDVPAKQKREVSIDIISTSEGILQGAIVFLCQSREEYSRALDLSFKVVPKVMSAKAELIAPVRTTATYKLPITNPLNKNVTFTIRVENGSDVISVDSQITVKEKSTVELPINFFPLVHKEYPVATVTAASNEIGSVVCKLHLRSIAPRPSVVTRVSCPLGQNVEFPLKFTSYSKTNCEFTIRLPDESKFSPFSRIANSSSIKVQGCSRSEGTEVTVDMLYEPSTVGDDRQTIEIVSQTAGVYIFPIVGTCLPPRRQGPFAVRTNQTTPITFKNVFNEAMTINVSTDSPCFVVSKTTETIPPKKVISIGVQHRWDEERRDAYASKLTISGVHKGETISWIYYLKLATADQQTPPP